MQLERGIRERIPFIGVKQDARLLDYACGTGMLSRVRVSPPKEMSSETLTWTDSGLQVLAQHTSEAIGIDLSEEMVRVYNAQAQSHVSTIH